MTGAFSSSQASMIAWSNSMLLTLKAPRAYFPFKALANKSRVCVSGIVLFDYQLKTTTVKERGIIGKPLEKKSKIIPPAEAKNRKARPGKPGRASRGESGLVATRDDFAHLENR